MSVPTSLMFPGDELTSPLLNSSDEDLVNRQTTKEEKFEIIYQECLRLIHERELAAVTHSTLSRRSGISRGWIYKYIGDGREAIIEGACRYYGQLFTELATQERSINSFEDLMEDLRFGTLNNLNFILRFPYLLPLYVRFINSDNVFGRTVKEIEESYVKRLTNKISKVVSDPAQATQLAHVIKSIRIGVGLEYGTMLPNQFTGAAVDERKKTELLVTINQMIESLLSAACDRNPHYQ